MRTSKPRRALGAQVFLDAELLEARFLCAANLLSAQVFYSERLTSGVAFNAAIMPDQLPLAGGPAAAATMMAQAGAGDRMDTFILPAGDDEPEIRVRLSWGTAPDLADASLDVLDTAGATLYRFPIGQVGELHAEIPVGTSSKDTASGMYLELDLQIWRMPAGSTIPGVYNLALCWKPISASPPITMAPGSVTLTPSIPGQTAPQYPAPATAGETLTAGGSLATVQLSPPPSLALFGRQLPAAGPGLGGIPAGSVLPSGPTSVGVPVVVGGHGPGTPVSPPPVLGGAPEGRGAGVVVGPLPLGRSAPDGGIFERSFTTITPPHANDSLVTRTSIGLDASSSLPTVANGPNAIGDLPPLRWPVEEVPGSGWASNGQVPPDEPLVPDEVDPDEEPRGLILLPPLRLARARPQPPVLPPVRTAPPRLAARQPGSRGPWWTPAAATLIAATGSAILVLKLNAPERARVPRG